MFKKIDHIGIAVPDLEAAEKLYETLLGKKADSLEEVADQQVRAAFFGVGETHLELLFPTGPESPIAKFLEKNNNRGGLHHICLEVEDIDAELARLKAAGCRLVDNEPRIGAHGKRIAFVHPKSGGGVLIELSQTMEPHER